MLAVFYGGMGLIFLRFFALAGMLGAFAPHAQADQATPAAVFGGIMLVTAICIPII
jgi:hypothetical protein